MDWLLFITTFWTISLIPGLNMTLALSLGMSVGYKKTLFMIVGATLSLMVVAFVCAIGVGFIVKFPIIFNLFTLLCAFYLLYIAYKMFVGSKHNLNAKAKNTLNKALFMQGIMSSISNPKAWAFLTALFPHFMDTQNPFGSRLWLMLLAIGVMEIISFNIYALGGAVLKKIIKNHAFLVEKISAFLIAIIAILMIIQRF